MLWYMLKSNNYQHEAIYSTTFLGRPSTAGTIAAVVFQ